MHEWETSKGLSPDQTTSLYAPGVKVRVTQQIPRRTDCYTAVVEGVVVRHERMPSGSWYARNKSNKVWLDRLIIKKADGEMSILNLDEYSAIEVLEGPAPTEDTTPGLVVPGQDRAASIT